MDRREFIQRGIVLPPLQYAITGDNAMPIQCDISVAAVEYCYANSFDLCGIEPNVIFCGVGTQHYAERIVAQLAGKGKLLAVLPLTAFAPEHWCVGNLNAPHAFFGSSGA